ncbi:MAG: dihydrofolate reductase [Candidatus Zixiibacteriota bacterium]|nr:MAG: dihydrofolate reductase [candidate division Zixibacteria bacterium]
MRHIILYIASSLDGYLARPDGGLDWLPQPTEAEDYGYRDFYASIDTIIMGRKTYDLILTLGPYPYAGKTVYVLSRTRAGERDERVQFIGGDIARWAADLKAAPGKDLWLEGGGEVVREFLAARLIDRLILTVVPVLIGRGLPLFPPGEYGDLTLRLIRTIPYPDGLVQVTYDVIRPV